MVSTVTGAPDLAATPITPDVLAQMASALFSERPGAGAVPSGIQAPVNVAPPGSPLASPAGLGPSVPGTPIPQGVAPGANLLPASPTPVLSLAHRAPALLPHAQAGNGVPDSVLSNLPAYEPRLGASVQGVPQAVPAYAKTDAYADAESASSYCLLRFNVAISLSRKGLSLSLSIAAIAIHSCASSPKSIARFPASIGLRKPRFLALLNVGCVML